MNIPQPEKKYILTDIIKKRRHQTSVGESRTKQIMEKIATRRTKTKEFVHPEKFVESYRKQQQAYAFFKKKARRQSQNFDTTDLPVNKNFLVIRIRGLKDISNRQTKILKEFRLGKINTAVFVKATVATLRKLKLVENYITYGYQIIIFSLPSRNTINQLIVKRGHTVVEKTVIPLKSNEIIEEHLGAQGQICTEDLVNSIADCSEQYDVVTKFLAPFKLNHPKNALQSGRIKKPISKGGEWGYREERINQLVQDMI